MLNGSENGARRDIKRRRNQSSSIIRLYVDNLRQKRMCHQHRSFILSYLAFHQFYLHVSVVLRYYSSVTFYLVNPLLLLLCHYIIIMA